MAKALESLAAESEVFDPSFDATPATQATLYHPVIPFGYSSQYYHRLWLSFAN